MSNLVEEAFQEGGLLSKQFPGYIPREQQIDLARKVQESIRDHKLLFGQAPTGVGKSLAALVPAAEVIFQEDAPVVVVTSSIVLQEQYFHKDVPTLERVLGRRLNATLIKGRNNYLCVLKANEAKISGITNSTQQEEFLALLKWSESTKTGDMSELDFVPKYAMWSEFAALEDNECKGKRCPAYDSCHYYRERKKVMASKLIICNYHYFFQALQNETMLPAGVRVVVMDEGHEISAIARDFQERAYTVHSLKQIFSAFLKTKQLFERHASPLVNDFDAYVAEAELNWIQDSMERMFSDIAHYFRVWKKAHSDALTLTSKERSGLQDLAKEHYLRIKHAVITAKAYANELLDRAMQDDVELNEEEEEWVNALGSFASLLEAKQRFMERFFRFPVENLFFGGTQEPEDETVIFWLQAQGDLGVSLHVKPSMSAPLMEQVLDTSQQEYTPIILSATLAVGGKFDHLVRDLGVTRPHNELCVSSPFDLTANMLWYLPKDVLAGNEKEHLPSTLEEMMKIIRVLNGRTLCLFTSIRNLNEATATFRRRLPSGIEVIAQNEYPRRQLIDRLKKNPNTVLMGTKSFFTGIDIQGQNLSAVLIDKLPFPMIGDPVNDYLMSRPGGFWTFSIPELVVSLKQAMGRLNRTVNDKGVVAVFDSRLSTGRYKGVIFDSFDFKITRTREWEQVQEYLQNIGV